MARRVLKSLGVPSLFELALLAFALCPSGLGAQQEQNTPLCDVHVDLQYESRPGTVVRSPIGEVAPPVVQLIMSKAGEVDWDELTKHGKKYPSICLDAGHPYYVLVWGVTDYDATIGLYVLDNGCLVFPSVFGTVWIGTNRDKAIKKVFEAALRFLSEKGKQPAPARSDLGCYPPEWIGPTKYKLTRGNAAVSTQARPSPAVQPGQDVQHVNECNALRLQQSAAIGNKDWQRLVDNGREYLMICKDLTDPDTEALVLGAIGEGLNNLKEYDDALPVLRRCVKIKPDSAVCYVHLAESFKMLKQWGNALQAYRQAIDIGGYDAYSAAAVKVAKEELAQIAAYVNALPGQLDQSATAESTASVGTGFFVSEHGYILTNAHVVSGCKQIQTRDGRQAALVSKDEQIDLALLKVNSESPAVASFRLRPAPRIGDSVVAFGFPLQGILSSEGNLTTGTVAAVAGIGDDPRFLQVSNPIQPGNSGSPLLDSGGDVIGVVEAKLDAVETLRIAGDIPQNVNFAIRGSEAIQFLERNHVAYHADTTEAVSNLKVADVAARAKQFSLPVECLK